LLKKLILGEAARWHGRCRSGPGYHQEDVLTGRDRYRDNDDVRDPLEGEERMGVKPESLAEARGDARETVDNNTRGTDSVPTGPEGNDKTRNRPLRDEFDEDLKR
jgi:hypothetical protein